MKINIFGPNIGDLVHLETGLSSLTVQCRSVLGILCYATRVKFIAYTMFVYNYNYH